MFRRLASTVAATAVAAAAAASLGGTVVADAVSATATASHRVDGRVDDWRSRSPLVAGATAIEHGELVHQDHIYDDTGSSGNRTAPQHSNTPESTSFGHFRYPDDPQRYAGNAADLFDIRLAVDAERVWFLARLNALRQVDTTVVTLAVDVDGGTEQRTWPRQAGVTAKGVDIAVTLWGTGGEVADLRTGSVSRLDQVAVSAEDNAIEAAMPRSLLSTERRVRMWVTSGLWDATSQSYQAVPTGPPTATMPGHGTLLTTNRVWNAAFRPAEGGAYQDEVQAAALRAADVTPFSHDVDLEALEAGSDAPWRPEPGRFYVALVDTGFTIPPFHEGASYDGVQGRFEGVGGVQFNQQFDFFGRFQPYGLYLPSTWDGRTKLPAALVLHGYGGSHSSYNRFPGFLEDFGEHPPTILMTPLARGSSFYADYGEREVLEVLADAGRRWATDPERLYLTGYSMGGYGVYRLAVLYPDRFAAAVAWAGYTGEFTGGGAVTSPVFPPGERDRTPTGDPVLNLESLLHIPLLHLTGTNDQTVPITGQLAAARRLNELGYRYRLDLYPGYEHLSFAIVDDWSEPRAWLGHLRREKAPRDVVLAVSEAWRDRALQPVLDLPGWSAWWLTDARQRDGRDDFLVKGVLRATSRAIPGRSHVTQPIQDARNTPTPHVRTGIAWQDGETLATENRLDLDLVNVASAAVDLGAAGLDAGGLTVLVSSDGAGRVELRSNRSLEGATFTVAEAAAGSSSGPTPTALPVVGADDDRIGIAFAASGRWLITVDLAKAAPSAAVAARRDTGDLPATGAGTPLGVGFVVLTLALAARSLLGRVTARP